MAKIRFFASVREAAGCRQATFSGASVGAVLDAAVEHYGADFETILQTCTIWCNGEPADRHHSVSSTDEVAVLPPVSGG
ncbi:MAG: MoaD/ThiS family protein [Acidimicrobiia bacterium]|nr:MoaD/ThiS family protein [Acidimicrobiia bacterium]MCY4457366.1 MoaD/ThiS family protein [Acidimicrobiaceae bacterium]